MTVSRIQGWHLYFTVYSEQNVDSDAFSLTLARKPDEFPSAERGVLRPFYPRRKTLTFGNKTRDREMSE